MCNGKFALTLIIVLCNAYFINCYKFMPSYAFGANSRHKRALVYPPGDNYIQYILGIGLPIELHQQSITIGTVAKMTFRVPNNSSYYTDHLTITESMRKKRSVGSTRWNLYQMLTKAAEGLGFGGKACVLQTICETAEIPFDYQNGGIFEELLHVVFTPSSTPEVIISYSDSEYLAAEELGRNGEDCKNLFSECRINFLDMYSKII